MGFFCHLAEINLEKILFKLNNVQNQVDYRQEST
jgi:hypothetical protein